MKKLGIIGSGKMGTDLFHYLSDYNYHITWFILYGDEKEKLSASVRKKNERLLKHGLIQEQQYQQRNSFTLTNDLTDLSACGLIIETITEDKEEKQKLFKRLKHIVKNSCIIASNSSSVIPSLLSEDLPVVGMHFFYPIAFKNVVELIHHAGIEMNKRAAVEQFLASINKKAYLQDENQAFLLNRYLLELQIFAFELVKDYQMDYITLDEISRHIVPDFGLFEVMGHVGLDTMYNAISNYGNMPGTIHNPAPLLQELALKRKLGASFTGTGLNQPITENIQKQILGLLKNKSLDIFKAYVNNFGTDENIFRDALNEFCGIQL